MPGRDTIQKTAAEDSVGLGGGAHRRAACRQAVAPIIPLRKEQYLSMTTLTPAQRDVLDVISEYGPLADHITAAILHQSKPRRQSSSGIRTRRSELERKRLVRATGGRVPMASGRAASTFAITPAGQKALGA